VPDLPREARRLVRARAAEGVQRRADDGSWYGAELVRAARADARILGEQLLAHATEYWTPTPETPELEALIDGEIEFDERVTLREILEAENMLAPAEPPPQLASE
jgi:hypothetical protein